MRKRILQVDTVSLWIPAERGGASRRWRSKMHEGISRSPGQNKARRANNRHHANARAYVKLSIHRGRQRRARMGVCDICKIRGRVRHGTPDGTLAPAPKKRGIARRKQRQLALQGLPTRGAAAPAECEYTWCAAPPEECEYTWCAAPPEECEYTNVNTRGVQPLLKNVNTRGVQPLLKNVNTRM